MHFMISPLTPAHREKGNFKITLETEIKMSSFWMSIYKHEYLHSKSMAIQQFFFPLCQREGCENALLESESIMLQ